jgi:hypothetical protein
MTRSQKLKSAPASMDALSNKTEINEQGESFGTHLSRKTTGCRSEISY